MLRSFNRFPQLHCGCQIIKEIVCDQRKRKYNLRDVLDAQFYILRTGTQWRNLPDNYPPWETVYYYFRKWKKDGTLECLNSTLNKLERKRQAKKRRQVYYVLTVNQLK